MPTRQFRSLFSFLMLVCLVQLCTPQPAAAQIVVQHDWASPGIARPHGSDRCELELT